MITTANLHDLLSSIGYVQVGNGSNDVMSLHIDSSGVDITVDFTNQRINYPDGIEADRDTTKNFSANENFVVLECVTTLLKQGYLPQNIVLEPSTPGGREDSHFYCDILVRDNTQRTYMLIECKTMDGKDDDEYSKAWKKTLQDGGQLFNYYNTYRQASYMTLYASDFVEGKLRRNYRLITMTDNNEYLESNPKLLSFEKVAHENGSRDDFFKVWKDTYGQDSATNGAFEIDEVSAFGVTKKKMTIDDLIVADGLGIQRKYHQFAQTLRQYNVASHENAFDKLVNLFLVKVVDEVRNPKDLQFLWKGAAYDDYYSFQDRLQKLYQIGMKDYLGEDVTYIDNASIENAFRMQRNDPDAIKDTILEYFRQLKFYSNSDFGFLDVHNKQLFVQNAVILKAMVEMLQDMRLKTDKQNQFLGDLFEGFLDQGVKQNEGQFFTPTPITRFMVSSLPLEKIISESTDIPKAIDYACGAGHFLNEYASQIKPFVEKYKGGQSLPDYYKQIYGIEKEYRLSKVSKVSSFMYGQDGIQIIYGDALVPHSQIKDGEFKVLIANPPYSVTGFLATLSKEERSAYSLNSEIDGKQLDTNNSIEAFFIERAKQLLSPGGVATIVLPSSILTSVQSKLDIKVREILIQYFDIVAITEFSAKTFGETPTHTISLFLRRKGNEPEIADHYRNRVNAWFDGNHDQDHRYEDDVFLRKYSQHIGVDINDYISLLSSSPSEKLMENEPFTSYQKIYADDTEAKKIKKRKVNTRYSQEQKDADLQKHIIDSIRRIEKEKLFYYMLCDSNPQPTVIVKSPTGTKESKLFLGYEWSKRKGNEGIKYLGAIVEDEENDISANKGIQQIQTPLFDPQDLGIEGKINTIIRNNYLGKDIDIPEELADYVSAYQLVDLLDFNQADFDKAIKTTPILIYPKVACKEDIPTKNLSAVAPYVTTNTKLSKVCVSDYISTDNMLPNRAGITPYEGTPNVDSITEYKKGDILVSNIRPYLKKIWIADRDGGCSKDVLVFRNIIKNEISNDYLKLVLSTDTFFDYMMVGKKGMKMPRGNKKIIPNFEVPMPETKVQKKIVDECDIIDRLVKEKSEKSRSIYQTIVSQMNSAVGTPTRLEHLSEPIINGLSIKQSIVAKGLPITRIETIAAGYLNRDKMGYGNLTSTEGKEKYILQNGDILFSHINSHKYVGKCVLCADLADDETIIHGMNLLRIRANQKVMPEYLYLYFLSDKFKSSMEPFIIDAGNQSSINSTKLSSILIPIPSLEDQKKIVSTLMTLLKEKEELDAYVNDSQRLKQEIINKYIL